MRTMISGMTAAAVVATVMAGGLVGADECPIAKQQRLAREAAAGHVQTVAFKAAEADIVDTAVAAGDFTTLVAAVKAAGLVETLKSEGPFTVFAPTDAAFIDLYDLTETEILEYLASIEDGSQEQANLTGILLYHVARGNREAAEVLASDQIRMLSGDFTYISIRSGSPYINDSLISGPDAADPDNGIIHVIDAVLLPPTP